jgi:hypothetical protein
VASEIPAFGTMAGAQAAKHVCIAACHRKQQSAAKASVTKRAFIGAFCSSFISLSIIDLLPCDASKSAAFDRFCALSF